MFRCSLIVIAALLLGSAAAEAADLETLVTECEACHGPNGISGHADMPTIAGQSQEFLFETLKAYQVWDRPCVKSAYRYGDTSRPVTTMCAVTETLTDAEMTAVSAHFAALPFVPAAQEFDPEAAAVGEKLHAERCAECHLEGGAKAGRGPIIAGQWTDYLREGMKYIPTGEHLVPPIMEREIAELTDAELDALMNYYASRQP
jgi:sulfide dehydrogenase cytochrome subunit